jgi:3-hydroxy-9,10-secoandrosta-1,3,5(10)-triene-9,17-dione monooxygenase reductase component
MRAARAGPATAAPGSAATAPGPEPERFRQVLGHFCTGVTVITTVDPGGRPHGFTCQSFAALSLDPPLVLFCPSRASATWPRIARAGHFCANVLTAGQRDLARAFGTAGADKFAGVTWSPSSSGAPVLAGVLTWAGCEVETVHEGGDHHVVLSPNWAPAARGSRCCSTAAVTASRPRRRPTARPRWSTPCSPGPGTRTGSNYGRPCR